MVFVKIKVCSSPRVSDERAEHKADEAAGIILTQEMQKLLREDRVQGGLGSTHLWKGCYRKYLGTESRRDQAQSSRSQWVCLGGGRVRFTFG